MSDYTNLKILAVTRMLNQICVAGVDNNFNWRRPVRRESLNMRIGDIFHNDECIIKNYNQVKFQCECKLNNDPHSEDFAINTTYQPQLIKQFNVTELSDDFNRLDESENIKDSIREYLLENSRSLVLIKPNEIRGFTWFKSFEGKYQPRIQFELNDNEFNYPCTDLKWRAYGKSIDNRNNAEELLNARDIYFVIGLTRIFNEIYYPMIVGIHVIPDYQCEINYKSL